ncbi:MAG: hypothetical protein K2F94_03160, partial [Muribaculaceae bacterium]|nr:hypothetical protein [Muribaculaceae bacterium]
FHAAAAKPDAQESRWLDNVYKRQAGQLAGISFLSVGMTGGKERHADEGGTQRGDNVFGNSFHTEAIV